MAGEYDKQFEDLTKLLEKATQRTDSRLDELTEAVQRTNGRVDELTHAVQRTNGRVDELTHAVQRTNGRVDELTLEVRDLRKTLLATNGKIDVLHGEVTGNLILESKRIRSLEDRVDILEQKPH